MWLIENVSVLDSERYIPNASVLIDGNTFGYIGDRQGLSGVNPERVIDGKNKLLTPGFINMHTHIPMTLFRNAADDLPLHEWLFDRIFPLEEKLCGEYVYWGSLLAIAEMLRFGVTAFNDMYFFMNDIARAVELSGIRAQLSKGITADSLDSSLCETGDLYKHWHNGANGRITVSVAPHAEYTNTIESVSKSVELADRLNMPLHIHISETHTEHRQCVEKYGKTPLQWFASAGSIKNALLAHCVAVDGDDIALLSENNCSVLHCPGSNMKLASGFAPIPQMLKSGVNVCLGTDGAASNNALNIQREMYLASVIHKGFTNDATAVTARESFKMATLSGASALNINAGLIKEGMLADFVLIDRNAPNMNPQYDPVSAIVYSMQPDNTFLTCVDGNILYENGRYTTLDIEKIIYMVNSHAEAMKGV